MERLSFWIYAARRERSALRDFGWHQEDADILTNDFSVIPGPGVRYCFCQSRGDRPVASLKALEKEDGLA